MDIKPNKTLVLVILSIGIFICMIFFNQDNKESYSNCKICKKVDYLDDYKCPKGVLKKVGKRSIPKTVTFKEFDMVKKNFASETPWFQADSITKYDPKYVDVFQMSF